MEKVIVLENSLDLALDGVMAVRLAKVYAGMNWREWVTSDLDEIRSLLKWLARQCPEEVVWWKAEE